MTNQAGSKKSLWIAILFISVISLSVGWYINKPYKAIIDICNAAPYPVKYSLNYKNSPNKPEYTEGLEYLDAGKCTNVSKEFHDIEPIYYVHAQSIKNEKKVMWIHNPDIGSTDQVIWPYQESETTKIINNEPFAIARKNHQSAKKSDWNFLIYDNEVSFLEQHPNNCEDSCRENAVSRALTLSKAVDRQIEYAESWEGNYLPFFIATKLIDYNGSFGVGIKMEGVLPESIFGDPLPIQEGDIVHSVNGVTIFSPEDFYMLLHEHALSRNAGIEKPINLGIVRNNSSYEVETLFFFNYNYWGSQPDDELKTVGYGITDAISMGATAEAICGGEVGLQHARNVGSKLGEFISEKVFETSIDMGRSEITDLPECIWTTTQKIARLRQYDSNLFENSAWFSLVTPSAPRLLLSKRLANGLRASSMGKKVAKKVSTAILEVSETLLWTINSASPLTTPKGIVKDIRKVTPLAVGAGIVAGALVRR